MTPSTLMDHRKLREIDPAVLRPAQGGIVHALLWVFAGMLALSLLQVVFASLISKQKADHKPSAGETMEAMG